MKQEFESYLNSIELSSETIIKNVERLYQYASKLCPEEIKDMFVSDFIKENGSREYENLWFFSQNYMMEARNFRNDREYDIDIAKYSEWISYYRTQLKDYDLVSASSESRMSLQFINNDNTTFMLKASRGNCDKLISVIENYVKKNI